MSSLVMQHPEDGLLLRYIDGELPARKGRQVHRHLEACWQCRTELEELQGTVADCVRYRKNVLEAHLPLPPNPWPDLYREFARIDSQSGDSWMARLIQSTGSAMVRQWAITAAVLLAVAATLWYGFRETPAVQAAALLKRAVSAADALPPAPHALQIRTRTQKLIRTVGKPGASAAAAAEAPLRQRFAAAHYSWEDPLSARSYQSWRDTVPRKQDQIATVPDPQSPIDNCYEIRTFAEDGDLAVASLMLRTTDLRPVFERLEFRDQEWVELTEFTEATTLDGSAPAAMNVGSPERRAVPSRPAAAPSGPTASISEELQVLSALHEIGADLGDPVDVTLKGGHVLVSGVGVSSQLQRRIHDAVDPLPHVQVEFSEPSAAAAPEAPALSAPASGGVSPAAMQARMERQLGGHAEFEKFSSQVLDRSESLMARAYALRALAQRFPAGSESAMSPGDRELLRRMAADHASALDREFTAIQQSWRPVLASLGAVTGDSYQTDHRAWQPVAEEVLRVSRRVEVLTSALLGVAPADGPPARIPSELLGALSDLRVRIEDCRTILSPPRN